MALALWKHYFPARCSSRIPALSIFPVPIVHFYNDIDERDQRLSKAMSGSLRNEHPTG